MNTKIIEDFTREMIGSLRTRAHHYVCKRGFKARDKEERRHKVKEASEKLVRDFAKKHGLHPISPDSAVFQTKYADVLMCPRLPWKFNLLISVHDVSPAQWGEIVFPLLLAGAEFDPVLWSADRLFIDPKNKDLVKELLKLFPGKEESVKQPRPAEVAA